MSKRRGQNEGTIFEERRGRWVAAISLGYKSVDGKRRRVRKKFIGWWNLDRHRQNSRKPARCQDTTVSGFTSISDSVQPGHRERSAIQNSRSRRRSLGRLCFRLNTASCCRSATASSASLCRDTKRARTYANITKTSITINRC